MKRLSDLMGKLEPAGSIPRVGQIGKLLGMPVPLSLHTLLDQTEQYRRIVVAPLTLLQQNLGLFPSSLRIEVAGVELLNRPLYIGTERDKILPALIEVLRLEKPDVVGLSELWTEGDKQALAAALGDLYPYVLEGPNGTPNTLKIASLPAPVQYATFDGGLMLLSRHPIVETHETIYRQCKGEDCFTRKGALHARISVAEHDMEYDLFLTHMQSCPPEALEFVELSPGGSCTEKLRTYQMAHLAAFVQAYSSPRRPALLMGDLNHDGLDKAVYDTMIQHLFWPVDLWLQSGDGSAGITFDSAKAFEAGQASRPASDPARHKQGSRLDYCLSWPGLAQPLYSSIRVRVLQSTPGARDISDHYGLMTHQTCLREAAINTSQPIGQVRVLLGGFRCLKETSGPLGDFADQLGSDEVEFVLDVATATGASRHQETNRIENVDSGTAHQWQAPESITLGDPGDWLDIAVEGFEVDPVEVPVVGEVGHTDRSSLGRPVIRLQRDELLRLKGSGATRVMPLMTGNNSEYAAYVTIFVN